MKVILVNGSPHAQGCTYAALCEVSKALESNGIETELFTLGQDIKGSCLACGFCKSNGRCVMDDAVNRFIPLAKEADGFVFGSPVHYAAPCGNIMSFLSRLAVCAGKYLTNKPAASVVSCRRAGSTAALDTLNKFYPILGMPMVPSQYWNMVHGAQAEDVLQDAEGLQIMRNLGVKMAWMLKNIQAGKESGVPEPVLGEPHQRTNFIR